MLADTSGVLPKQKEAVSCPVGGDVPTDGAECLRKPLGTRRPKAEQDRSFGETKTCRKRPEEDQGLDSPRPDMDTHE